MGSYEDSYLAMRPQELCNMCGRCCRVVTTSKSYEELKALQAENDEGACEFLKIFVPYPSIEAARAVDKELVDNVINLLIEDGNYDETKMTFYGCKYLREDNLCSIYEERPVLCRHCPADIGLVTVEAPSAAEQHILKRCPESVPVLAFPFKQGAGSADRLLRTEEMAAPELRSLFQGLCIKVIYGHGSVIAMVQMHNLPGSLGRSQVLFHVGRTHLLPAFYRAEFFR